MAKLEIILGMIILTALLVLILAHVQKTNQQEQSLPYTIYLPVLQANKTGPFLTIGQTLNITNRPKSNYTRLSYYENYFSSNAPKNMSFIIPINESYLAQAKLHANSEWQVISSEDYMISFTETVLSAKPTENLTSPLNSFCNLTTQSFIQYLNFASDSIPYVTSISNSSNSYAGLDYNYSTISLVNNQPYSNASVLCGYKNGKYVSVVLVKSSVNFTNSTTFPKNLSINKTSLVTYISQDLN